MKKRVSSRDKTQVLTETSAAVRGDMRPPAAAPSRNATLISAASNENVVARHSGAATSAAAAVTIDMGTMAPFNVLST